MIVHRDPQRVQVVAARRSASRFAGRLHRRQQQRNHNANDGDHDQQLDERKRRAKHPTLPPLN